MTRLVLFALLVGLMGVCTWVYVDAHALALERTR